MIEQQRQVSEFHSGVGQPDPWSPIKPDERLATLRFNLIYEEFKELAEAMGLTLKGELEIESWNEEDVDMIGIVDGSSDLLYVTHGTNANLGIDIQPFYEEVHRSNMTKVKGGRRREDGKWMKPDTYTPADLEKVWDETYGSDPDNLPKPIRGCKETRIIIDEASSPCFDTTHGAIK